MLEGQPTERVREPEQDLYRIKMSPSWISNITDVVMDEVKAWPNCPLNSLSPIPFLDALRIKIWDRGHISSQAIHLVWGLNLEGQKEILGLWITENEGAKFWLKVWNDLNNWGRKDVFIACVGDRKGFPKTIEAVFPKAQVQLCIVDLVRN